jgi:alpha-tubulin suppressor-like RCC1 family protein
VVWGEYMHEGNKVPTDLINIKAVAANGNLTAVLKEDGTMSAWGRSERIPSSMPKNLKNVKVIAAGSSHLLALVEEQN